MKKINPIDTHSLTNGAHYNFMEAIYTNLNSILLYGEKLKTELPAFKTALDSEDAVLVLSRKSDKTDEIANADKARDNAYVGYKYTVKGFTYLGSGAQYEAAKVLTQHLTDYQIDTQMSLSRQTGLMTNLIEDLESTYSEQIESLGLTPFVTMMKNGNEKVKSGLQSRDNERAGQTKAAMLSARADTDAAYQSIVDKINALYLVDTTNTNEYVTTIDEINAQIKHYKEQELTKKSTQQENNGNDGTTYQPFYPKYL